MALRDWNAGAYDALPLPHAAWGRRTIERLAPSGRERVLDAGCGTGRDAAVLLAEHPGVSLVGIDGSESMIAQARARLAEFGERATLRVGDLAGGDSRGTGPIDVAPFTAVDAVLSVACFHWIADHRSLFERLLAVLVPGGRLVSECGGEGNIGIVQRAIAAVTRRRVDDTSFFGVRATRAHLAAAGFVDIDVRLRPHPVRIADPDLLERFLATVILGAQLEELGPDVRAEFVTAVREAMTEPVLDYQRLEVRAVRPTAGR